MASKPAAKRQTSNLPVNYAEQLANEVSNIQQRIAAPAGDRIRMVNNSHFALPNGQDADAIECVVVDFVSANLLFEGAYDKDNPSAPGCFAVGPEPTTLIPTNNAPNKQAETCAVCPNNQFGSAGKGKACKNTRLLAVKPIDGDDDNIYVLSVPPTSIKAFDGYVHTLAGKHRLPPVGVVTRISLDKNESFAAPRFEVVKPLDSSELGPYMEARTQARERLVAEPDFTQYHPPGPPVRGAGRSAAPATRRR
jgi:hypothetical protein